MQFVCKPARLVSGEIMHLLLFDSFELAVDSGVNDSLVILS